jgi:2-haloacid dehalogenase/putative hydrolase of the HAD superfamily
MQGMLELDGVFLDMYGTLTTGDRAAVEAACAQIIRDTGVNMSPRQLGIAWGERFFAAVESCHGDNFRTLYRLEADTLRETLAALGVTLEPGPYIEPLTAYWRDPPLHPEVPEFLARFTKPICIVSNADQADIAAAVKRHGIPVAGLVTSEQARSYKPHARIFELALEVTGWRREHVLHVGDSLHSDVGGARRVGLRTGWVNRAHRIHDIGNHQPDYEFDDLLGLHALLCPPAG